MLKSIFAIGAILLLSSTYTMAQQRAAVVKECAAIPGRCKEAWSRVEAASGPALTPT